MLSRAVRQRVQAEYLIRSERSVRSVLPVISQHGCGRSSSNSIRNSGRSGPWAAQSEGDVDQAAARPLRRWSAGGRWLAARPVSPQAGPKPDRGLCGLIRLWSLTLRLCWWDGMGSSTEPRRRSQENTFLRAVLRWRIWVTHTAGRAAQARIDMACR
jgi:hypothetical protein